MTQLHAEEERQKPRTCLEPPSYLIFFRDSEVKLVDCGNDQAVLCLCAFRPTFLRHSWQSEGSGRGRSPSGSAQPALSGHWSAPNTGDNLRSAEPTCAVSSPGTTTAHVATLRHTSSPVRSHDLSLGEIHHPPPVTRTRLLNFSFSDENTDDIAGTWSSKRFTNATAALFNYAGILTCTLSLIPRL